MRCFSWLPAGAFASGKELIFSAKSEQSCHAQSVGDQGESRQNLAHPSISRYAIHDQKRQWKWCQDKYDFEHFVDSRSGSWI